MPTSEMAAVNAQPKSAHPVEMQGMPNIAGGSAANRCLWCDTPFTPNGRGAPQRFCTPAHRQEFHSAGRRWAEGAVFSGRLTVAELRSGPAKPCTARTDGGTPNQVQRGGSRQERVSDALRRNAVDALISMPIEAEAVIELAELGWLPPNAIRDPRAICYAIIDACEAVLTAGLGPTDLAGV